MALDWTTVASPTSKTLRVGLEKREVEVAFWPRASTLLAEVNGTRNVRYLEHASGVVGGKWTVVSFYNLQTVAWDGRKWTWLAGEKAVEQFVFGDDRVDAMATEGVRAWAVSVEGAVFEWTGTAWEQRGGRGTELFAEPRRFMRVAWDSAGSRLVAWGGQFGKRMSNDTLFFEKGVWRKAKKPSPKLAARKADNYWIHDDAEHGGLVRVGPEGCAVLRGERWEDLGIAGPCFVSQTDTAQMVVAHTPATKKTLWIDPIGGVAYLPGQKEPAFELGTPPGMVTRKRLQAAGAYFDADFTLVNDQEWCWGWDPQRRTLFAGQLGSGQVATLALERLG